MRETRTKSREGLEQYCLVDIVTDATHEDSFLRLCPFFHRFTQTGGSTWQVERRDSHA